MNIKRPTWICDGEPKDGKRYSYGHPHEPVENTGIDCKECGLPQKSQLRSIKKSQLRSIKRWEFRVPHLFIGEEMNINNKIALWNLWVGIIAAICGIASVIIAWIAIPNDRWEEIFKQHSAASTIADSSSSLNSKYCLDSTSPLGREWQKTLSERCK